MRKELVILLAFGIVLRLCAPAWAITFRNFSQTVTLTPKADGTYALADGSPVELTNRMVVKAAAGVSKEALRAIDPRVSSVTELYKLAGPCYYVVTFSEPGDLADLLNRFSASSLILLAQPDLLQIHDPAAHRQIPPEAGECLQELHLARMWEKSLGQGVKIAIIDDGFALDHEDLRGVNVAFGYDLVSRTLDPSPRSPLDVHGTQVAGIIFARHNGLGGNGIAPGADLIAIRHPDTWTSRTLLSFYLAKIAGADIINCSWKSRWLPEPLADIITDLIRTGRGGKGIVLVFAAGNEGIDLAGQGSEAVLPGVFAVGAVGPAGKRLKFSNFGGDVDLDACGENILTTHSGSVKYSRFSGTSAAAAVVSGTIALLLSRERNLSLAEIQGQAAALFPKR